MGTFYEKQTGRIAVGYKLGERLQLGFTANLIHSKSDRGLTNNDNTGTSYYVVLSGTPNFVDLSKQDGVYPANPAIGSGANPLQTVELLQNREDVWRLIGGANAALDAYRSNDGRSQVKLLAQLRRRQLQPEEQPAVAERAACTSRRRSGRHVDRRDHDEPQLQRRRRRGVEPTRPRARSSAARCRAVSRTRASTSTRSTSSRRTSTRASRASTPAPSVNVLQNRLRTKDRASTSRRRSRCSTSG